MHPPGNSTRSLLSASPHLSSLRLNLKAVLSARIPRHRWISERASKSMPTTLRSLRSKPHPLGPKPSSRLCCKSSTSGTNISSSSSPTWIRKDPRVRGWIDRLTIDAFTNSAEYERYDSGTRTSPPHPTPRGRNGPPLLGHIDRLVIGSRGSKIDSRKSTAPSVEAHDHDGAGLGSPTVRRGTVVAVWLSHSNPIGNVSSHRPARYLIPRASTISAATPEKAGSRSLGKVSCRRVYSPTISSHRASSFCFRFVSSTGRLVVPTCRDA